MRALPIVVLALLAAACSPFRPAAPSADNVADADADPGAIDNQTMVQMLDRTMNRFARLDLNGDGRLTQEELNAATEGGDNSIAREGPRQGFSARAAFAGDDANGDGVITRDEAEAGTRARFKALDLNADGKLSKDELAGGDLKPKARAAAAN